MTETRLNDVFRYWLNAGGGNFTGGFFSNLFSWANTNNIAIPFLPNAATATKIDYDYHGNYSGQKIISPFIANLIDGNEMTASQVNMLVSMFWALHGENCKKQFSVYLLQYNPIENYSMTETGTDTKSGSDETTRNSKDTVKNSGTDNTMKTGVNSDVTVGTETNSVWAFDSTTDKDRAKDVDSTTVTHNISESQSLQHGKTEETDRNATDIITYGGETTHTLSRSGNIGVTTSQQMIQSDIDLWQWNFYRNYLYPVVDLVCTIPIY